MQPQLELTAFADFKAGELGFASNGAAITSEQRWSPGYGKPIRALADVRAWNLGMFELVADADVKPTKDEA